MLDEDRLLLSSLRLLSHWLLDCLGRRLFDGRLLWTCLGHVLDGYNLLVGLVAGWLFDGLLSWRFGLLGHAAAVLLVLGRLLLLLLARCSLLFVTRLLLFQLFLGCSSRLGRLLGLLAEAEATGGAPGPLGLL